MSEQQDLVPPFELYGDMDIADANGHVATCENPEIAQQVFAALIDFYGKTKRLDPKKEPLC